MIGRATTGVSAWAERWATVPVDRVANIIVGQFWLLIALSLGFGGHNAVLALKRFEEAGR